MSNAGYFVEQGLDPSGVGSREFKISQSHVRHFMINGPASKFFESLSIPSTLQNPSAIFRGLEREEQEDGYCYAGAPESRYLENNITAPAPKGMIFTIYVNALFQVFEWRWEHVDPTEQGCPINFLARFTEKVWPH
jgi:hypothetical protein